MRWSTVVLTGTLTMLSTSAIGTNSILAVPAVLHGQIRLDNEIELKGRSPLDAKQHRDTYRELMGRLIDDYDPDSVAIAAGLQRISRNQYEQKDYRLAVETLTQSVAILERQHGLFSETLIEPLVMLGLSQRALGQYQASSDSLTRAQHITHRQEGVLNTRQLPMQFFKALNLMATDEVWDAEQVLRTAYRLSVENHGPTHVESIDAAVMYGSWLTMVGRYKPALSMYRAHLLTLNDAYAEVHPSMGPLIHGMAMTYLHQGDAADRGRDLLRQLVELQQAWPDAFSKAERYTAHTQLASLLIKASQEREARRHVEAAWQYASADQREALSTQVHVERGPFKPIDSNLEPDLYFDFRYRVRADGRPQYVKLLGSNANTRQSSAALKLFRQTRFRPRLHDGKAISVDRSTHRFTVDLSDPVVQELITPLIEEVVSALDARSVSEAAGD